MLYDKKWDIPTTDDDKATSLIKRAAEYMERHGWCQERLIDELGAVCLVGALRVATTRSFKNRVFSIPMERVFSIAIKRVQQAVGKKFLIADWNDNVCASKEQAVAMLRKAARI